MNSSSTFASSSSLDISSSSAMPTPGFSRPVKIIPLQHPSSSFSSSSSSSPAAFFSGLLAKFKRLTFLQFIERLFPCFRWIRSYRWRDDFQVDLLAGLTIGVMLVPQAMSYAKLAGLEPIYGLYTGFVPIFVYAIFGSSRQLAIGPVALVSLLVSNVLKGIAGSSDELYTELAIVLALMVGILECIMGLLRLGWLLRFISHSVISGFTTASAVVIGLSQAKYFLGYNITQSSKIVPLIKSIIDGADQFSWPPFLMGSGILAVLLIMKHLIGEIPQGLPSFSIPKNFGYAKSLIPTAFLITGVAILLVGLGLANIFGSFFSSYPSTGSFSRSAVSNESGAKTGLSGIITGIVMGCALLFLTPLFKSIPQCALAAIVVSAVIGLVEYEEAIFLWRVDKKDFVLWFITCSTTLFLGIEIGVLIGVGVSLAFVIHESANPHIAVLGRLPGTTVYRNIQQYPEAYTYHGIVIVRVDAPIYFANTSYIKDRLREYELNIDKSTRHGPEVERIHFVILEMSPVTYIDSSAIQALKDLYQEYKSRDIQIAISNPNREVLLTLSKSGIVELIGKEWYFVRVHDAVQVCLRHVESLHQTPDIQIALETKPSMLERLLKQRGDGISAANLESGQRKIAVSTNRDPNLEPLLLPQTFIP
ncbi:Sulfate transporter 4.1, chloroplastic [Linum perenne]